MRWNTVSVAVTTQMNLKFPVELFSVYTLRCYLQRVGSKILSSNGENLVLKDSLIYVKQSFSSKLSATLET